MNKFDTIYKLIIEGKGKKQRKLRSKKAKEREIVKLERPVSFNLQDKHFNVLKYRDRYVFVTTHAVIRRVERGVEKLGDKTLIEILFRACDYMYSKGSTFLSVDGNYMFYSKEFKQGVIIRVSINSRFTNRKKYDFKLITWLTHGNEHKPNEADKRIFIENRDINDYLNLCECTKFKDNLFIENTKIDDIFEIS